MLAAINFHQALSSYDKRNNNGINISHQQSHFQSFSNLVSNLFQDIYIYI